MATITPIKWRRYNAITGGTVFYEDSDEWQIVKTVYGKCHVSQFYTELFVCDSVDEAKADVEMLRGQS